MLSSLEHSNTTPKIHFDVFHDNNDLLGAHLGRAALNGPQLRELTAIYPARRREPTILVLSRLRLRPWTLKGGEGAIPQTHGALSAGRASRIVSPKPRGRQGLLNEDGINIVQALLTAVVDTVWTFSCFGRHLKLHIIDTVEQRDLGESHFGKKLALQPSANCRVHWNGVEVGHLAIAEHTHSWYASAMLSPTNPEVRDSRALQELALSIFVQDPFDKQMETGASFRGRVTLSHLQLWELRQVTLHGLRRRENSNFKPTSCLDVNVEYFLSSYSLGLHEGVDDTKDQSGVPSRALSLCMSNIAAAELPDTIFSSRLFGNMFPTKESLYVVARVLDKEKRSMTAGRSSNGVTWKYERFANLCLASWVRVDFESIRSFYYSC